MKAARTALTLRTGHVRPLEPEAADHWAEPAAALHDHLTARRPLPDNHELPGLPFLDRYRRCLPEIDHDHDE